MENKIIYRFTLIEEIRIKLPNEKCEEWLTEITCTKNSGSRVKLVLSSVDRYANIWALTHNFKQMELIDLADGITEYEFGRYLLRIMDGNHIGEQWFKNAEVKEI
ncbi:MAG: hypothetical protein AAFY71_21565 [Bacteroidota bacterium]